MLCRFIGTTSIWILTKKAAIERKNGKVFNNYPKN